MLTKYQSRILENAATLFLIVTAGFVGAMALKGDIDLEGMGTVLLRVVRL